MGKIDATGILGECVAFVHMVKTGSNRTLLMTIVPETRPLNVVTLKSLCREYSGEYLYTLDKDVSLEATDSVKIVFEESIYTAGGDDVSTYPLILAQEGDGCIKCFENAEVGHLSTEKAIEVGHTFYLGTKYSSVLKAGFKSQDQKHTPFEMGCYGIGVSRLVASVVEVCHDSNGIKWPVAIAPYSLCVVPVYTKNEAYDAQLEAMGIELVKRVIGGTRDVVLDDRRESFGFRMKDAMLIGYPYVIVCGKGFVENGVVEVHVRETGEKILVDDFETLERVLEPLIRSRMEDDV